jgi:hypothetical protein
MASVARASTSIGTSDRCTRRALTRAACRWPSIANPMCCSALPVTFRHARPKQRPRWFRSVRLQHQPCAIGPYCKLQPIGRQCARMAFARTTQTKPHLVDPQSLFVWHTPPKLLRAEARVAAQFATKVRLIRVTSFGRDACPVNMQLRGVRSHQQNVFRSCKPPQCAGRPTGHRAHLSFKLASAPPFGENVSSRYGGPRPLAVSLGRSPPSLSPSCCGVGFGALSACSWRCLCWLVSRSSVSV